MIMTLEFAKASNLTTSSSLMPARRCSEATASTAIACTPASPRHEPHHFAAIYHRF
ncbi:MAG: hypothetical protein ACLT98_04720 [Eggerthellaceae bacterium]